MRRIIKIMGKLLSAIVLLLIFLPVLLMLLLEIPAVQNFVVRGAAQIISDKLETRVSIDRVDIGLFYRLSLDGFYVEDFQKDTLLYVGHLDARIKSFGLLGGGIVLERAELTNSRFCLHETPQGEMNISQIINKFVRQDKPESPGNFSLTILDLQLDGVDFCLERLEHSDPPHGVDFAHMHLIDICAAMENFVIDGPVIHTTIHRLSTRERSGFVLDDLSGRIYIASGCISIDKGRIRTAKSDIELFSFGLIGLDWSRYKYFVDEVDIQAELRNTTVSSDDIAYFAPAMKEWHLLLSGVDARMEGPVADFTGSIRKAHLGTDTALDADFKVQGLPDIRKSLFDVNLIRLTTNAPDANVLASAVTRQPLPAKVLHIADNAGQIALVGKFRGSLAAFTMNAALTTSVGAADCTMQVESRRGDLRDVRGNVKTTNIHLGKLLDNKLLGPLSLSASLVGVVGSGYSDAEVSGQISRLEINGSDYDSLCMNGRILNREFNGRVEARDKNLNFDFTGLLDLNDQTPRYDFSLDLVQANLAALGINRRDSVATLSGRIDAQAVGRSLDDLNGLIVIRDAAYAHNDRLLSADSVVIEGRNSSSEKFIELRSSFADATYQGRTSYKEVFAYLRQRARDYIPMLDGGAGWQTAPPDTLALTDDYSQLTVNIKKINPLANAISPGLQIADGSQLQLRLNPVNDRLSLTAASDYIERDRMLITRLCVDAQNQGDSLVLFASTEDLYLNGFHMSRVEMNGGAKENRFVLVTDFADTTNATSGRIGFRSEFTQARGAANQRINIGLTPSYFTRGTKTWDLYTDGIMADSAQIRIDRFRMVNAGQELLLDGVASRSPQDSVRLSLSNFDLAPFSQFTSSMGYTIDGRTNGSATMKSVLKGGEIRANIVIDSIRVNNSLSVPALWLRSKWDIEQKRAGIMIQQRENRDTLVQGFYAPAQNRYYARATLDGIDLAVLDPMLKGVIGKTQGTADALITFQGEGRAAELSGKIGIRDFSTTVDFTQVTYSIPSAVIEVKNNHLTAKGVPVFDPDKNRGDFSIDLNLEHLSNISYTVGVLPHQMMVLNTTQKNNDLFYGRMFATGSATIAGSKGGVRMNIVATTEGNSEFFMPLSGKSNVKKADFVTFVTPEQADTANYLVRKKMLFQRQNSKKESVGSSMDITLALDVKDNTAFQLVVDPTVGDILKGRGNGMLNLHINPQNNIFGMYGDYTLTEGSYQFTLPGIAIVSKKFQIEAGSMIQWMGEPLDARLDINAIYKLKTSLQPLLGTTTNISDEQSNSRSNADRSVPVDCKIHIGGRLASPQLAFSVDVPVTDIETQAAVASVLNTQEAQTQQFIYLLVFNSFAPESLTSGRSNLGASAGAATGLELLSNQLSNWFSTDAYRVMFNYRPSTELTGDEVDFGFSTNLVNNRLLIEVEGNYIIDNKQAVNNNVSNFMGEAHVTWLIDRSGNLRLSAFTQTLDRFDENQGLQETGLGISYKEDFNNFKDLKQRIRDRFTNEKRQAKREARREEQARRAAEESPKPEVMESEEMPQEQDYDQERN